MEHKVLIKQIEHINHNVLHIVTDKPKGYTFSPGQATELSIDKEGFREKKRPFTFTSLPEHNELEFTIKVFESHDGVTKALEQLKVGNHLHIGDSWGAINYQGEGTFIAGGAGITPFIAILKDLKHKGKLKGNTLFFSNHKEKDIIYKQNLEEWLGDELHLTLTNEHNVNYNHGHIDKTWLTKHQLKINKPVYLCGPPAMMEAITSDLYEMGLSKDLLITED